MTTSYSIPSGHQSQNLLLDSSIRDWVVLPLLFLMIEAGLLRHYLSLVLNSAKGKNIPKVEHRVKNACFRAGKLRSGAASFLSRSKWEARRMYWTDETDGYFTEEIQWIEEEKERDENDDEHDDDGSGEKKKNVDDDMPDPMALMGPMKGQAVFMIQNMVMMQGIGFFFQGYVLLKVPFPLTMGFKMMFQRGLDLSTLETSYVSSVSWYFLVMFGLRAFFRLVIEGGGPSGGMSQEQLESMAVLGDLGVTMSGNPMQNKFDPNQMIKVEKENLDITKFKSRLDDAERRLLGKKHLRKKLSNSGAATSGGEPGYDIFGVSANQSVKKVNKKSQKLKSN